MCVDCCIPEGKGCLLELVFVRLANLKMTGFKSVARIRNVPLNKSFALIASETDLNSTKLILLCNLSVVSLQLKNPGLPRKILSSSLNWTSLGKSAKYRVSLGSDIESDSLV